MKENNILRKIQYFFKRNAYALSVSVCVLLAITMISLTVANYMEDPQYPVEVIDVWVPEEAEEVVPTATDDVIIFSLPVEDGRISKEYA